MNAIERGVRGGGDPDLDSTSDLDEPMGSQSVDVEAPLTHNSSKSNFFASPDSEQATPDQLVSNNKNVAAANRGSFKTHVKIPFRKLPLDFSIKIKFGLTDRLIFFYECS